jgi:hemolysin III
VGLRQRFNSISHMAGGGLALVALPFLFLKATGALALATVGLYAFGLLALYTMSSLYHAVPGPRAEVWLERLDHVAIYLLIAGTYSPVSVLLVGGALGWWLFVAVWAVATTGVVLALTVPLGPKWAHILGYIALGWSAVVAAPVLIARVAPTGWALLLGGGLLFSGGGFLYVRDRPVLFPRLRGFWWLGDHEAWHLFVLAGSALHFWFVYAHVVA